MLPFYQTNSFGSHEIPSGGISLPSPGKYKQCPIFADLTYLPNKHSVQRLVQGISLQSEESNSDLVRT